MAPPTEKEVLSKYLLAPAQLPEAMSLAKFAAQFPRRLQQSEEVAALYADLQSQRAEAVDEVAANIERETTKVAAALRKHVRLARAAQARQDEKDEELEIEHKLFGTASGSRPPHSLSSALESMEVAVEQLEEEIRLLEAEEAELLRTVNDTIDGMSDLRYGKFSNPKLKDEVLEGLESLQATCKEKT